MPFNLFLQCILLISSNGKFLSSLVYVTIYCVGAGITTLTCISNGSDRYFFRRMREKTRSVKEKMDGRVFISRKTRFFSSVKDMIEVLFRICIVIWRVNSYVSRQGKVYIGEMKVLFLLYKFKPSGIVPFKSLTVCIYCDSFPSY